MKFCPKCGTLILPKKIAGASGVHYECKCGYTESGSDTKLTAQSKVKDVKTAEVAGNEDANLPVTKMRCEKCGNEESYWWEIQTRASDEPATRFYKCRACKHTWRDYS